MRLNKETLCILTIIFLCTAAYANILFNGFAWDDERFIQNRPETREIGTTLASFKNSEYGIYRPIRTFFYYISYKLFRVNPFFYHLLSILLHIAATLLIYFIIRILFERKLAFLSSALFAVHPIHVGRVSNATASFDIIGIIFLLLSLYLYIIFRKKNVDKYFFCSISLFAVGLFASEEVMTLPLLIVLYEFIFGEKGIRKYFQSGYYFAFLGIFLYIRVFLLHIASRVTEYPGGSSIITFLTMPKVIIQYILLSFLPLRLTPFRMIKYVYVFSDRWFILPVLGLFVLVFFVFRYRQRKEVIFFSGWFIITMLPFLNILPLQKIMAERYFYLASLGIFAFISGVFIILERKLGKGAHIAFAFVIVFLLVLTVFNNGFWKDDLTLMERGIDLNPYDSKALDNLGVHYYRQGDVTKATEYFESAVKSNPKDYTAWSNLGSVYSSSGQYREALRALTKAIELKPLNYEAYDRMGIVYMRMGDDSKAEEMLRLAIHYESEYYPAYSHLGTLYGRKGDYARAKEYMIKAVDINPYYAEGYYQLGMLNEVFGKKEEAQLYFKKAVELEPDNELYQVKAG